jgi:hypothetical protein
MYSLSEQSASDFAEAQKYLQILENSLGRRSKFTNDLLYNIVSLCTEKLFMAYLAHFRFNATHHTPMALFNEANKIKPLPEGSRETIRLVSQFESICQFDAFGYKTPTDAQFEVMITGLIDIKNYIDKTLKEVPQKVV